MSKKIEDSGVDETLPAAASTQGSVDETLPAGGGTLKPGVLPILSAQNYEIGAEHARGGLGRILRARDLRLGRPVAIKELIHPDVDDERRFAREALVTARLQHPAIVPVYEAGRWPSGAPFYAMKLVNGRSLEQVIRETVDLPERLAILPHVIDVAHALAYAHGQRIIHRDLKPANVLVGAYGETVVIDWGLAKDLSAPDSGVDTFKQPSPVTSSTDTIEGSVMGTPAYMPPEQAHGQVVDERADVYALGAVLYHVLCGEPPYMGRTSADVLMQVVTAPPIPLEERQAGIPTDLVTIVRTAMAAEPKDRYPTAKELAEDLVRFQRGQLVSAHSYSAWLLFKRWLRRHRAPVAVAAVMVTVLVGLSIVGVKRIVRERDAARAAKDEALATARQRNEEADALALVQARLSLDEYPSRSLRWLSRLSKDFHRWGEARVLAADAMSRGVPIAILRLDDPVKSLLWSSDGRYIAASANGESGRQVALWDQAGYHDVRSARLKTDSAAMIFTPGNDALYLAGADGIVHVWTNFVVTFQTGRPTLPPYYGQISHQKPGRDVTAFAFSGARDNYGWFATGSLDGTARLWSVQGSLSWELVERPGTSAVPQTDPKAPLPPAAPLAPVTAVAFSPTAPLVATAQARHVAVWEYDAAHRATIHTEDVQGNVTGLLFDRRGRLVIASDRGEVLVRDVIADTAVEIAPGSWTGKIAITQLAYTTTTDLLAAGTDDGHVTLWNLGVPGKPLAQEFEPAHDGRVGALVFSPDGTTLASGGGDRAVRLWDLSTGRDPRVLRGHAREVTGLAFSPAGGRLASAGADGAVLLWDLHGEGSVLHGDAPVTSIAWGDAAHVAFATEEGRVSIWDLAHPAEQVQQHERVTGLSFAADGRTLASSGWDDRVRLWRADHGSEELAKLAKDATAVALSADGRTVAFGGNDGTVGVAEVDGKTTRLVSEGPPVIAVALSEDGKTLAWATATEVHAYDVAAGQAIGAPHPAADLARLALSPHGRVIAWSGAADFAVTAWRPGGDQTQVLRGHAGPVRDVAFSPDDTLLASAGADKKIFVWNLATGHGRPLVGHTEAVTSVSFAPLSGTTLASGAEDGTVRLWDVASGRSRVLLGHVGAVNAVAMSPDEQAVASAGHDGSVRVFRDDLPEGEDLRLRLQEKNRELVQEQASEGGPDLPAEMLDKPAPNL